MILKVCQVVKMEMFVRPILKIFMFLRDLPLRICIESSYFLPLKRPSLLHLSSVANVVSRTLLSIAFFIGAVSPFFLQRTCAAYAAISPPDIGVSSQSSQDNLYGTHIEKAREEEEEHNRAECSGYMQSMLQEIYQKLRKEKVLSAEAKNRWLKPHKAGENNIEKSFPAHEQRVLVILDKTFQQYNERAEPKVGASSYLSSYEVNLRQVLDAMFASLQKSKKELVDNKEKLVKKTSELINYLRVEDMRLQMRALRDMEKARSQLKVEEIKLINKLADVIRTHLTLQQQFEVSNGKEEYEKDIGILDMEIALIWEKLLDVKQDMYQTEIGSFRAAVKKLPNLEKRVEETVAKLLEYKSSRFVSLLMQLMIEPTGK